MGGAGAGLGTALAYRGLLVVAVVVFRKHPVLKEYDVLKWSWIIKMWKEPFKIDLQLLPILFFEVAAFKLVFTMSKFGTFDYCIPPLMHFTVVLLQLAFPHSVNDYCVLRSRSKRYSFSNAVCLHWNWVTAVIVVVTLTLLAQYSIAVTHPDLFS